jgi:hypothetical protein
MINFFKLVAWIVLVTGLLVIFTRYAPGEKIASQSSLAGYPLVSIAQEDARGVIAIGQTAYGVVVLAQGGGGVITFAQGGVGVLFGLGQGIVGLIAFCQIGIGLLFILAQLGGGVFCLGQVVVGYAGAGQGAAVKRGIEVLKELDREVGELLARPRLRGAEPPAH